MAPRRHIAFRWFAIDRDAETGAGFIGGEAVQQIVKAPKLDRSWTNGHNHSESAIALPHHGATFLWEKRETASATA